MPSSFEHVADYTRKLVARPSSDSDAELLGRFVANADSEAFAHIMQRHATMVWNVCRRGLSDWQAAEDAFQATFVVLAHNAAKIRNRHALPSWLHGVALRITKGLCEQSPNPIPPDETQSEELGPADQVTWQEVRTILDIELTRLPEKYRLPLVLCYLEGMTQDEAARTAGWSKSTLRRRLERGRDLLRVRLHGRGVTLAGGLVPLCLGESRVASAACVTGILHAARSSVVTATVPNFVSQRAIELATRYSFPMSWPTSKLLLMACVLAATLLFAIGYSATTGSRTTSTKPERVPTKKIAKAKDPRPDGPKAQKPKPQKQKQAQPKDDFPPKDVVQLGSTRLRHYGVQGVTYSPDGKTIASVGESGGVRLWDAKTGERKATLQRSNQNSDLHAVAYSPKGRWLVAAGDVLQLWDTKTNKLVWSKKPEQKREHFRRVLFMPDGKHLFVLSNRGLSKWAVDTGKGSTVKKLSDSFTGHEICYSTKLKSLVVTGPNVISILNPSNMKLERRFPSGSGAVFGPSQILPDSHILVTFVKITRTGSSAPGEVFFFNLKTGKHQDHFECNSYIYGLAVSPDGKYIALRAGRTIQVVRTAKRDQVGGWRAPISEVYYPSPQIAFSPDGKKVVGGVEGYTVSTWDMKTGRGLQAELPDGALVGSFFLSPNHICTVGNLGTIKLWNAKTGKRLRVLPTENSDKIRPTETAQLSANRRYLCVAGGHNLSEVAEVFVWDLKTGREHFSTNIGRPANSGWNVAMSRDASRIVVGWVPPRFKGFRTGVTILDRFGPEVIQTNQDKREQLRNLWFTIHGRSVLTYDSASQLAEWGRGNPKGVLLRLRPGTSPTLSEDRRLFVQNHSVGRVGSRSGYVTITQVPSGRELFKIYTPETSDSVLALSPDNRYLAVGTPIDARKVDSKLPRRIQIWELATGHRIWSVPVESGVTSLGLSPDGTRLVSGTADGIAYVWNFGPIPSNKAPSNATLKQWWNALGNNDGEIAHLAQRKLAGAPAQAVAFLEKALPTATPLPKGQVLELLDDLESDNAWTRQIAFAKLKEHGPRVFPALRKVLQKTRPRELKLRVRQLLEASPLLTNPQTIQRVRAVFVLEMIGTRAARRVLSRLAKGDPSARTTQEAQRGLERLKSAE